ncbi:tobamovirus multiplication protein 1-like isoform X2 [Phoenix dactylifera]|uniref:Tobamovirus multiplication protein 1-like isoform X2 n=1 Tax=Phoenix dactylifera TaxID=42345 RepID=A0A8B7C3D3_PHODC|nr:tobamovirus multiplication protein 1-like isoform X2 [Phoenix dactylifera]
MPALRTAAEFSGGEGMAWRNGIAWWDEIDGSEEWQRGIFYALCAAYSLVSLVALVQLIRIHLRVPEYGWTTQKLFHLMNFVANGLRAVLFGFYHRVFLLKSKALEMALLDLPGLLFFSTYTLLVLFWAEIYHQARSLPIDKLRPTYLIINGAIYITQICIWVYVQISPKPVAIEAAKVFLAIVSFSAAFGFLIYGGRLFFMLRRFPIESKGRQKKLNEVGSVTAICCACFLMRCFVDGMVIRTQPMTWILLDSSHNHQAAMVQPSRKIWRTSWPVILIEMGKDLM